MLTHSNTQTRPEACTRVVSLFADAKKSQTHPWRQGNNGKEAISPEAKAKPQQNLLVAATFLQTASHSQDNKFSHFLREDNTFSACMRRKETFGEVHVLELRS